MAASQKNARSSHARVLPRPGPVTATEAGQRNQRIISVARELFVSNGLNGTSLDAIAREAQVTKRTIYQHYESKEGLFVAALTDCVDAVARAVRQTPAAEDLRGTLAAIAGAYGEALEDPATLAMYRLALGESERIPPAARRAINLYGQGSALGVVSGLLQKLEDCGLAEFRTLEVFSHLFLDFILAPLFLRRLLGYPSTEAPAAAVSRFLKAARDLHQDPLRPND